MKRVTKIDEIKTSKEATIKRKVAAYCRVSTGSDAQLESLETQKSHYENYITARPDWELAGIYFDEGITGTKKDKRSGLLQMISDCERQQIDFIITKSISRFARNTTDCLELVRKLLNLGIPIYFEKENLNTGSMESELMLSILSSMAEGESTSISENSKWSTQKRFQNGTYIISYPPYGYDNVNGEMVIVPEQAAVIKRIFSEILAGKGIDAISTELNKDGILSKKGGKWHPSTIRGIVSNEKYTGDVIFQKTYTDSGFNRHKNNGQRDQYMMQNHHEAIVSHETFETAAAMIAQRAKEKGITKGDEKYQKRYALSGKIICGECGATFRRRIHSSTHQKYPAWCCNTHLSDTTKCSMLYVKESAIELAFITMMNKLIFGRKLILKPLLEALRTTSKDSNLLKIKELEKQLLKNSEQKETLMRLMAQGYLDPALFNKEKNELMMQADGYHTEIEALNHMVTGDTAIAAEVSQLLHFTERCAPLQTFDEKIFRNYVKRIVVYSRMEIGFEMKCGLTLKERM